MQCVCGAHWCYWCQKSTQECDGACEEREEEDDEEDDYDSEEDDILDEQRELNTAESRSEPRVIAGNAQMPPPTSTADFRIVNLDAGGDRRWAETYVELWCGIVDRYSRAQVAVV